MFNRSAVCLCVVLFLFLTPCPRLYAQQATAIMMAEDSEKMVDEAWQGYQGYLQAIKQGSWKKLKSFLPKKYVEQMEKEVDIHQALQALYDLTAENVRMLEGWVDQGRVHLVVEGESWEGLSKGVIVLGHENGNWKILEEAWKAQKRTSGSEQDMPGLTSGGSGTISGVVVLPETEETGSLYVRFVPEGQIVSGPDSKLYQVIPADRITSIQVPFEIKDVPEGSYWGLATWDIAEFFWEPSWGEGNCPGYAGDYTGGTKEKVVVTSGQETGNVQIECLNYLIPIVPEE